jgi:prepilin-type processing-associated H-X9-DG protein
MKIKGLSTDKEIKQIIATPSKKDIRREELEKQISYIEGLTTTNVLFVDGHMMPKKYVLISLKEELKNL